MTEKPKRKANLVVFGVLGLLVISLGGFGIGNFGGSVRAIGAVGDTEIPVSEYAVALQGALREAQRRQGTAVSLASPEGQRIIEGVQRQMIGTAALEGETARLGLSVGDEAVRQAVVTAPDFQGLDGTFDRDAYEQVLRRLGLNEREFETNARESAAARLTTAAVLAGTEAPETMVEAIAAYAGERRDILWLTLDAATLTEPLPAPTEAELQAAYDADPAAYTEPEKKRVSFVSITPEMLVATITVDEAELRALYDERSAEFNRPQRRLVERLILPNAAEAEAARAALDSGASTFEALVAARGLTLADVDLGDMSQELLGDVGAEIFALGGPGVVGPLDTPLGPALFRVNAILQATETPFEEAREALTDEVALDRARREIGEMREGIDDLLAGGATLEEIADETEMELGTLELGPDTADGIAGYAAFREAASVAAANDFPELQELEDGGLFALRLDAIMPPALLLLEDVRDRVVENWSRAETEALLTDRAEAIRTARAAGESYEAQGIAPQARDDLARESFLDGAPEALIGEVFKLAQGETAVVPGDGAVHLIELVRITPEDPAAPESVALRDAVAQGVGNALAQDILDRFVSALEAEGGITRNQTAINAVHAQFP